MTVDTEFGHNLTVHSDKDSAGGRTLVTLDIDACDTHLFPAEARALAKRLLAAADRAEGV